MAVLTERQIETKRIAQASRVIGTALTTPDVNYLEYTLAKHAMMNFIIPTKSVSTPSKTELWETLYKKAVDHNVNDIIKVVPTSKRLVMENAFNIFMSRHDLMDTFRFEDAVKHVYGGSNSDDEDVLFVLKTKTMSQLLKNLYDQFSVTMNTKVSNGIIKDGCRGEIRPDRQEVNEAIMEVTEVVDKYTNPDDLGLLKHRICCCVDQYLSFISSTFICTCYTNDMFLLAELKSFLPNDSELINSPPFLSRLKEALRGWS